MKQSKWSLKYPSVLAGLCILIICLISLILPYRVKAALTGTNFPITTAASTQDRPAIASDGTNYLVVYHSGSNNYLVSYQSSTGNNDIYANYVSVTGTVSLVGAAGVIVNNTTRREEAPSVSADGTNYFIAWVRAGTSIRVTSVSGTGGSVGVVANGVTVGTVRGTGCTGPCGLPSISFGSGTSRYLLAFESFSNDTNGDIWGNTITTGGAAGTSYAIANTAATQNRYPSVTFSSGNGWLAVWQDARNSGTTGNDIYGQLISTAGALSGANFSITTASNDQNTPRVTYDGINYFVTWQDSRNSTTFREIYGNGVSTTGVLLSSTDYPIASGITYNKQNPAVGTLSGDLLITWGESRTTWDIYGQLANQPGISNLGLTSGYVGETVSVTGMNFGN